MFVCVALSQVYYGVNAESMGGILANDALNCCYGHQHFTSKILAFHNVIILWLLKFLTWYLENLLRYCCVIALFEIYLDRGILEVNHLGL